MNTVKAMPIAEFIKNPPTPSVANGIKDLKEVERQRSEQAFLLADHVNAEADELPKNYLPFVRTAFTSDYEEFARQLTNPNGRGNSAFDMEKERAMLPQDSLVRVWGWFHGQTGFSAMFKWASGRQDAYVVVDNPNADPEVVVAQGQMIEKFRPLIAQYQKEQENKHGN